MTSFVEQAASLRRVGDPPVAGVVTKASEGGLPVRRRLPACPTKPCRRRREAGMALLLVFLMAAIIGIMLFLELPRVAFDAQRQKEQLLIERGQQYQLAIRRYMQRGLKNGMMQGPPPTWPTKIEDLENTNGRRFLRKRYMDPMTGKDEWRLIHINNGMLTDSVNNKNNQQTNQQWGNPTGIVAFAGLGETPANGAAQGLNAVNRRRASDSLTQGGLSGQGSPGELNGGSANNQQNGTQPASGQQVQGPLPGAPGFLPGGVPANGPNGAIMNGPVSPFPGQPGQPGQIQPLPGATANNLNNSAANANSNSGFGMSGGTSSFGGSTSTTAPSGVPGVPGAPANSVYGGSPYQVQGQPGAAPTAPPGSVQNMLNSILMQPRPGGAPAGGGATTGTGMNTSNIGGAPTGTPFANPTGMGTSIGGGLAGVASTVDADSIMVCGDHSNYKEWEFIFDPSKWKAPANPNTQLGGTPAGSNNNTASSLNTGSNSGPGGSTTGSGPGNGPGGPGSFGSSGGPGGPGQPGAGQRNTQAQGQSGMPGQQGNFGNVCGMEARPGAR